MRSFITDEVFIAIMAIITTGMILTTLILLDRQQNIYNQGYKAGVAYGEYVNMSE